jgi:hypothetical protein
MDNTTIEERLSNLEYKIEKIYEILQNKIEPQCNNMDNHISFIENVYSSWRYPISWILSKINCGRIESPDMKSIKY